jgi:hypothetical protein
MPTGGANIISIGRGAGISGVVIGRGMLHCCLPIVKVATSGITKTNIGGITTTEIRCSSSGIPTVTISIGAKAIGIRRRAVTIKRSFTRTSITGTPIAKVIYHPTFAISKFTYFISFSVTSVFKTVSRSITKSTWSS